MCYAESALSEPPAKEAQPPENADLKKTIDAMAPFVARNGAAFEAIAIRQNARDNRFSFLKGGPGAEYYRWRVQASSCDPPSVHIAHGHACVCIRHRLSLQAIGMPPQVCYLCMQQALIQMPCVLCSIDAASHVLSV